MIADGAGGATDVGSDKPTDAAGDRPRDVSPGSDAILCPSESDNGALKPSGPACTVAPLAINAALLCAGAAGCPIGALYSLTCAGSGYGPWVVPAGQGGSVMFVTNTGGFVTRLFTMVPGVPPEVNDVPGLTSAENAIAVDSDGNPTIFGGEMPGAWRVRKTPQGWRREHAVEVGSGLAMVTDGIAIDAGKSFIAYFNLDDQSPRLAIRDGSCWRSTLLSGTPTASIGLDVDGLNRPWTAWFTPGASNTLAVDLVGPDGNHRVWMSAVATGGLLPSNHPVVMARGVTGTSGYPALAMQRPDGVHILVPGGTPPLAPTWTDRVVPSSAMTTLISDCPTQTPPAADCAGRTSCQSTIKGVVGGFGAARTASGRTYAAWLASDGGSTYALGPANPPGMFCMGVDPLPDAGASRIPAPPRLCGCQATVTASHGTGTIVISRVDTVTPTEALRINFDTGAELRGGALALAARGDTLLIVASLGGGNETKLRYVEVDTTSLP